MKRKRNLFSPVSKFLAAKDFGSYIDTRYKAKLNEHADDCKSVDLKFFPVVFSTGGAISIERIAELKADRLGIRRILHRIGVAIQIGNAYCIHSHLMNALRLAAKDSNVFIPDTLSWKDSKFRKFRVISNT